MQRSVGLKYTRLAREAEPRPVNFLAELPNLGAVGVQRGRIRQGVPQLVLIHQGPEGAVWLDQGQILRLADVPGWDVGP